MKQIILFLSFFVLLASCDNSDFTEFSELGSLRIVGIEASTPEVDGTSTGTENVTLTPFISDINASGRSFNVTVVSCLDATFAQTGELSCSSPTTETYPNGNTFDTSTLSGNSYTGAMDPITISINNPASLISSFSTQLRFNGVPFYVFFTMTSGSETLNFVKQLRITDRGTLNQNPVISDVLFNGSSLGTAPSTEGTLELTFTSGGSPETFLEYTSDGTLVSQEESYLISWFSSEGEVNPPRVLTSQTSKLKTSLQTVLIGVVRDRRGGTDITVFTP